MDLIFPISHPLEFFVYVFAPAWAIIIALKYSCPSIKSKLDELEKQVSVLGKPLDYLLIISLLGISFDLVIYFIFAIFGFIIFNSPLGITPSQSVDFTLFVIAPVLGTFVWMATIGIILLLLFFGKFEIWKKLLQLVLDWIIAIFLFFHIQISSFFQLKLLEYFLVCVCSIVLAIVCCFFMINVLLAPDVFPLKYLLTDDSYPFVFYANCSCNDTTMQSNLYVLNSGESPLVLYWIKSDPQPSNANLDYNLPITLNVGDNTSLSLTIPRSKLFMRPISLLHVFAGTSKGTYLIPLDCNTLNVYNPGFVPSRF